MPIGQRQQFLEQVNAGHALGQWLAEQAAGPDHGLAIGEQHVAIKDRVAQLAILAEIDDFGGIEHADQHRLPRFHGVATAVHSLVHAERIDR
ncbi:hypothetical protein FQZ97_1090700 [compost metagenome]